MASRAESEAMRRAITLAALALGQTSPNPVVGCVILDAGGRPVGEGFHARRGLPHAEIQALRAAGGRGRGGTAVVTLEPCDHTGMTGPCTQALIVAGIARVVFAVAEPNPAASGGSHALRAAGVDVEGGVLATEAAAGNVAWLTAVRTGRPYVTWKFAATLDGRSAAADGTSRWITAPEARADVQRLRAECDTILVGTGTVLADNPRLTVRDERGRPVDRRLQPLRAVMGLRPIPAGAAVNDDAGTVHLATRDPRAALTGLFAHDRQHVWLEGGPTLAGAFVAAGLVDRIVAYIAPALLGAGPAALAEAGVGTVAGAIRLTITDVARVGPDLRLTALPERG